MHDYHDETSVHTKEDVETLLIKVKDLEQKVTTILNEPKETRVARYKEWFRKGLYGKK